MKAMVYLACSAAVGGLLIGAAPVLAQDAAGGPPASGDVGVQAAAAGQNAQVPAPQDTAGDPNEIVVTALKRVERQRDVPKVIEVINQAALTQANVTNIQDLGRISPSIQGTSASGSPPAIRGISSFGFSIGVQAQTGLVLDDVPQPNFSTLANELSDVERVEVLPGPQSTLSGRNAAGGLINIVTRSPSTTLKANTTVEVTDDHQQRVAGYITGPINDVLGFSVSGFYNNWDGPLRNVATGDRLGGFQRSGVRAKLRLTPSSNFTATLTGYYVANNAQTAGSVGAFPYSFLAPAAQSFFIPGVPLASIIGFQAQPYNNKLYSNYEGSSRSHDYGASLRLEYELPIGTLTSISNISRSRSKSTMPLFSFSFLPDAPILQNYDVNYGTQEVRLTSPAGNSRLQYLAGVIYTDTAIREPYSRPVIAPVNWDRKSTIRSIAGYGRVTYAVLPRTFLTGGLRYQHDYQAYRWDFLDGLAPESRGSNKYGFVSGEASIRQELSRDANIYATYANTQTGRAYDLEDSGSAVTPAGLQPLASEKVQNYEVGAKARFLNGRASLNVSLFNTNYQNYQLQQAAFQAGNPLPVIRLLAIGRVRTRGIEIDGSLTPVEDLRLSAAATILDAKIRDYQNAPCYTGQTVGCVNGTQGNLAGTSLPGASRFKLVTSAAYTLRLPQMPFDGTLSAAFRYQTKTHFDVLNDPFRTQGAFGIANIAVGVQSHNERVSLQLFVNNLFNKHYYVSLDREVITYDPTGAANPAALYGGYARDSRRYGGLRLTANY